MSGIEAHGRDRLGLIWPDCEQGDARPDYELLRPAPWLQTATGIPLRLRIAFSDAAPTHGVADLRRTGAISRLMPPARRLAAEGCQALIWACTSGSFIHGLAGARRQVRLLRQATGLPVSSTTLAFIDALQTGNANAVDLLSPYPDAATEAFCACLSEAGIEVRNTISLRALTPGRSHRIDLAAEVRAFPAMQDRPLPLLVPDTAVNSLTLVEEWERITDRPLLTANQVTLWQGMQLLGRRCVIPGQWCRGIGS